MSNFAGLTTANLRPNTRKAGYLFNGSMERAIARVGMVVSAGSTVTIASLPAGQPFGFATVEGDGILGSPLTAVADTVEIVGIKMEDTVGGNDFDSTGQVAVHIGDRTSYVYANVSGAIVAGEGLTWDDTTKGYIKAGANKKVILRAMESNSATGVKVVVAKPVF